jgi:hypothetical protein
MDYPMIKKKTGTEDGTALSDDTIEARIAALREQQCPCPACRIGAPVQDPSAVASRIAEKLENGT